MKIKYLRLLCGRKTSKDRIRLIFKIKENVKNLNNEIIFPLISHVFSLNKPIAAVKQRPLKALDDRIVSVIYIYTYL